MSESTLSDTLPARGRIATAVVVASYASLGAILCWTRFAGLDQSYWHDEIVTVRDFVAMGPREILAGHYVLNNHELFSLLGWATSSIVGESEIALRLWSVIPFILGVFVVTAWLHIRVSPLSGVLYLFLATVAPLLLDVSRQARGYGLAFLAMSVLIVAALEAERSRRTWTIVAFCAAGLVGTWTLPNFGVAFLATGAVLLANPLLRRRMALGLGVSSVAIALWYAPHLFELTESSQQEFGAQIGMLEVVIAPIYRVLLPGLLRRDGFAPIGSLIWLPIVIVVLIPTIASPFLRQKRNALILASGVFATVAALWITGTYVVPRFLSFLLVPLFVILATGMASILSRFASRPPLVRTLVVLTMIVLLTVAFGSHAADVTRLPREAHKDAAAVIHDRAPASAPVFAYMTEPGDLAFYLERPIRQGRASEFVASVCRGKDAAVLVVDTWRLGPVDVPCATFPDVRRYRFEQYARGGEISVYVRGVP